MKCILAILVFLTCGSLRAATINAASPSRTHVGTAYTAASNGDTINIPAGTAEWDTPLDVAKAVTIQGAGIGQTIMEDSTGSHLFNVTLVADLPTRITGIEFVVGSTTTALAVAVVQGSNADDRTFRMDNCKFDNLYGACIRINTVKGVFDHNTLLGRAGRNTLAHVKGSLWDGQAGGNGAWDNADAGFGSDDFFFFEDNTCTGTSEIYYTSLIDAQAGGRYVFRNNTVVRGYVEGHGSEASYERSTHAVEVYRNSFDQGGFMGNVTYFRGGSGLVWSNDISNTGGNAACLALLHNRMNDSIFPPYGGADGRNPWDVNHASNPFATPTASSAGTKTVTVSGAGWATNQWAGYTVRATSGKAVTSVTRSSGIITVTATAHGFSTGNLVSLFGADQQPYNKLYTITVADANTFTASIAEALPTTPATGTIKARLGTHFAEIISNTSDTLTYKASIYEALSPGYNLNFATSDTFEINKVVHGIDQIGRVGGSLIDNTATPALPGGWNNQTTSAWYQWGNSEGAQTGVVFNPTSGSIVSGTHFYDNTAKPGYTPFTYPHPLRTGSSPTSYSLTIEDMTVDALIIQGE